MDDDIAKKDEILYRMFQEEVSTYHHIETKGSTALLASSFLILAGATVFGSTLFLMTKVSIDKWLLSIGYIVFFLFIASIAVGTFFIFVGMNPRFSVSKSWECYSSESGTLNFVPKSLYFSLVIRDIKRDDWLGYLNSVSPHDFIQKSSKDLACEIHSVAKTIGYEVRRIRYGFISFTVSSILLTVMVFLLIVYLLTAVL